MRKKEKIFELNFKGEQLVLKKGYVSQLPQDESDVNYRWYLDRLGSQDGLKINVKMVGVEMTDGKCHTLKYNLENLVRKEEVNILFERIFIEIDRLERLEND